MHFLYIIHSESANRYYVGETHDLKKRLVEHRLHSYDNSFTKIADDWEVVLSFECQSKTEAVKLEKFIKRMKSKQFIIKVIADPSILKDILNK